MTKLRARLTYSNVISTICLFVVLGGGAYAATALKKNSVKSKQIKNGQVKLADLGKGSVDASKVVDGSIGAADINETSLEIPVGGDLTGALPNPTIAANAVSGAEIADGSISLADTSERWAFVDGDGTILAQSGGIKATTFLNPYTYYLDFGSSQAGKAIQVTPAIRTGDEGAGIVARAALCGGPPLGFACDGTNNNVNTVYVSTATGAGAGNAQAFFITVN